MSQEMFIQASALAQMPHLPAFMRKACITAHERGGLPVGQFLQGLDETELDSVLMFARECQTNSDSLMSFSLFAVMLANGEGLAVPVHENLSVMVRRIVLMVQAEMLHREGLVVLAHDRLTLEQFDIRKLSLTEAGRQRFGGVSVVNAPIPRAADGAPSGDVPGKA